MGLLDNKIAVITGGARGIGKAIALRYAQEGANIAFIDLQYDDTAKETEKELSKFNTKCKGYAADVSNLEQVTNVVDQILKDFGKIDILVNNAGITRDNLLLRMSEEDWDLVLKVNLKSVYVMTKVISQSFIRQRSGNIINISSVVGLSGNGGQTNYSAAKAGMVGFTKSIAKEIGSRNIRCNAIAPGFIETEMTKQLPEDVRKDWITKIPLRRPGYAEDIADVALFLASDLASYVTGQVIPVCGGMHM
ncbi:MAG: 3-oxoacyl-[acyl-carrier-protein] reductase [Bacteroidales bacterium]|jgi:3-oxoacyl-[acyl-carrier protein] reductase